MYYRYKLVTNSSSSHSIVILNSSLRRENTNEVSPTFGWDSFILSSPQEKATYMAATLFTNLEDIYNYNEDKNEIIKEVNSFFGYNIINNTFCYVDHQSKIILPRHFVANKSINLKFFKDLCDYIINNNKLVILGGNDNEEKDSIIHVTSMKCYDPIWQKMYNENFHDVQARYFYKLRFWEITAKDYTGKSYVRVIKFPKN